MAAHLIDRRPSVTSRLRWLRRVVAWTAILAVGAALTLAVVLPRLGGATPYAVLTGSMRPELPPGTLVVMRPVPVDDIGIGTVITYQLASGEDTVVTHRVVGVAMNAHGERVFTTQGDANNVADQEVVRPVQIRGALWYAVPALGYANRYLTADQRSQLTLVVAAALLAYAMWSLVSGLRERRQRRREPVVPPRHLAARAARGPMPRRRLVVRRLRPLLPLLYVTVLAALGLASTVAYWSDSGTLTTGTFNAGVLDLKLDGANSVDLSSTFNLANMVPGESVAAHVAVQNPSPSTVPFTYTATGLATGTLASELTFRVHLGGTSSNSTVGNLRTGACGGTATGVATTWASSTAVIPGTQGVQQLAVAGTQNVCVVASLPAATPSNLQGTNTSAVVTFTATQLGAP